MYIDLEIIDNWDFSIDIEGDFIEVFASSPASLNIGWYRATIGMDGSFLSEKRMLRNGSYDPIPSTNRPPMKTMLTNIPTEHSAVIQAIKVAFGLQ